MPRRARFNRSSISVRWCHKKGENFSRKMPSAKEVSSISVDRSDVDYTKKTLQLRIWMTLSTYQRGFERIFDVFDFSIVATPSTPSLPVNKVVTVMTTLAGSHDNTGQCTGQHTCACESYDILSSRRDSESQAGPDHTRIFHFAILLPLKGTLS